MLADLETTSTLRRALSGRANAIIPCCLPDSQALVELTLREIETAVNDSQDKLYSLIPQLADGLRQDQQQIDRARHVLRGIVAGYVKHLKVILERVAARHHPHGRFGSAVGRLNTELAHQVDRLLVDQQQLGELSAEQNLEHATRRMNCIAAKLRGLAEQLIALVQNIRNVDRQPQSITLGGAQRSPHERNQLRDQLAWSLRRWWQTCTVRPGPMTIAVIDFHRLSSDCPDLSRGAVAELLNAAASLIVSDRRTGRAGISIDTTVISEEGDERYLAWSCSVIEDQKGQVQSIIAAGLDKTNSKPAKARAKQTTAVGAAAFAPPVPLAEGPERRRKQRNPFPFVQLIAPCTGTGLPPTSAFIEALCHDISEDGFSYLSSAMPSSTSIVVALGTRAPHLYMTARVAHFTRCDTVSGAKYIVGCQFTGRAMVMAQFA